MFRSRLLKMNTKGIRAVLAGVVLGALILFSTPGMLHAQDGTVVIVNENSFGINIYTEAYDGYGRPFWRRIGGVPPNGELRLPRVPDGIVIGADNKKLNLAADPREVVLDRSSFDRITFTRQDFR